MGHYGLKCLSPRLLPVLPVDIEHPNEGFHSVQDQ